MPIPGKKLSLNWSTRPLEPGEEKGDYDTVTKDFSPEELLSIGPKVEQKHCDDFKFRSLKSFTYCKDNEASVTESNADYPIFSFSHVKMGKDLPAIIVQKGIPFSLFR